MPMGKPSGLLLFDLDFRNGGPKDRTEVMERYGAIPETAEVITGAGRHIYFRDPGCPVPRQIAKGIELKSQRWILRSAAERSSQREALCL